MKVKGISSRENNLAKAVELSGKLLSRNIMWFRRELNPILAYRKRSSFLKED